MVSNQPAIDEAMETKLMAWFTTLAICLAAEFLFVFGISLFTVSLGSAVGWALTLGAPITVLIWPSVYARVYSVKAKL